AAPPGATIVLQRNGAEDLTVVAAANGTKGFSRTPFKFPKMYANGSPFTVTIKTPPAGLTCTFRGALQKSEGTISESAPNAVRIGCDHTVDLITRNSDNTKFGTFYESWAPVVGGNFGDEGRYVAFQSSAVGLGTSLGKKRQIFWRDRNTGETKLISTGTAGEEGNGDSFAPAISLDGQFVAFESTATNLVEMDTNG